MIGTLMQSWAKQATGVQAVLCSVIEWKGSVPRKDYPLMLVLSDGSILGTIGGGSMELKVIQSAREMIAHSKPALFAFDMTGTDVLADIGLCGGSLKVLVEPFTEELQQFYANLVHEMSLNPRLMVSLTFGNEPSLYIQRNMIHSLKDLKDGTPELLQRLQTAFRAQRTLALNDADQQLLLWQPFTPPALHIFGAGHVAQAVAQLAHFNELQVCVYDDRTALLTTERFPHAILYETNFPITWEALPSIPDSDLVLIASREHKHDRELMSGLLQRQRSYVGLVSSVRKWEILSAALFAQGIEREHLDRVHAPVGLGIEAQTVPEIAVSIMAELIAHYRGLLP